MRIDQRKWTGVSRRAPGMSLTLEVSAQLVLLFGSPEMFKMQRFLIDVKKVYSNDHTPGCSTAGEILDTSVFNDTLVNTAVHFEYTKIKTAHTGLSGVDGVYDDSGKKNALIGYKALSVINRRQVGLA